MNHYKIPCFIRKKKYKCNYYRIPHILYDSFQNQLQNSGQKMLLFPPTHFAYKATFLKPKSGGTAPTDTINWSQACAQRDSVLNCNILFH